jgi:hypothetical protein
VSCLEAVLSEQYTNLTPDMQQTQRVVNNVHAPVADTQEPTMRTEAQMGCLHRLFASKAGFQAFTTVEGYFGVDDWPKLIAPFPISFWNP